jgi:hypothetical protein
MRRASPDTEFFAGTGSPERVAARVLCAEPGDRARRRPLGGREVVPRVVDRTTMPTAPSWMPQAPRTGAATDEAPTVVSDQPRRLDDGVRRQPRQSGGDDRVGDSAR